MIRIEQADPRSADAVRLLDELSQALFCLTGSDGRGSVEVTDFDPAESRFVIARDEHGEAVGCGGFRRIESTAAELKRMYAASGSKGVGAAVLTWLEREALRLGYRETWCETRLVNERAVRFYLRHGYRRIANFGKYRDRPEAACFAKTLAGQLV